MHNIAYCSEEKRNTGKERGGKIQTVLTHGSQVGLDDGLALLKIDMIVGCMRNCSKRTICMKRERYKWYKLTGPK